MKRGNSVWLKYHDEDKVWNEYPDGSIFSFVKETAEKYPGYTALEFQNRKTTYKDLIKKIEHVASGFVNVGITKGDFVTIVSPNLPQALMSVYALNRIGAVANILHPLTSVNEMERCINEVNSKAIIILDAIYPQIAKIEFKSIIILMRIKDALPLYAVPVYSLKNRKRVSLNPNHNIIYWNKLLRKTAVQLPADNGTGDEPAVILYSGGTSGTPKGIVITNYNMNCLAVQSHDVYERDDIAGTHSLALMPIFHGFGLGVCMHGMLCNALHIFLIPQYDMNETARLIFKRKISFLFGVPALYEALSRSVEIETKDLSFIKFVVTAGDRTPSKLLDRFNRQLKEGGSTAKMREAYGQTECTSGCCINPFFKIKNGSIGIPYTDMQMKIVEPGTEFAVEDGKSGEICISGPTVMKEYLNNPDETEKTLRRHADGLIWLHTGDIGHKDEEGYYYFDQRYSRLIITSGYNVYPTEIEQTILQCRIVKSCCVIGIKDRIAGQRVRAYVVLNNSNSDIEEAKTQIMERCRQNVAEYALPHDMIFLKELPMTALGKIDYGKLENYEGIDN